MERRHPIGVVGDQGAFHRDNPYVLEVDGQAPVRVAAQATR
jgi:hypothetical protein